MADFKRPQFNIGDVVKAKGTANSTKGAILKYNYDGNEWKYVVRSKEVDVKAKRVLKGISTYAEDELILVAEEQNEN